MLEIVNKRLVLITVLVGMFLGACGSDDPSPSTVVDTAPPTTVAEPTTTTVASEETTTTTVMAVEEPPTTVTTTTTSTMPPATTAPATTTTTSTAAPTTTTPSTTTIPDETTTTTTVDTTPRVPAGDVIADSVTATAKEPISHTGVTPLGFLLPSTESTVVGWSTPSKARTRDGGINIVLDGWEVEHFVKGDSGEVDITLFVTLVGAFTGTSEMWLLGSDGREDGTRALRAGRQLAGTSNYVDAPIQWLDPRIWEPFRAGEERQLRFTWTIPADSLSFRVEIANSVTYLMYPQDPGRWGASHPPLAQADPDDLSGSCYDGLECETMGLDRSNNTSLLFSDEWDGRLTFRIVPRPLPASSDGMVPTDVKAWYGDRPDQVWFPEGDPWFYLLSNEAATVNLKLPARSRPLFVQWTRPDGRVLLWKTVATMRDVLFANPDWAWAATDPDWDDFEQWDAAVRSVGSADRICWAHWTGAADPFDLFPYPTYMADGSAVTVTDDMITWVVDNICSGAYVP